MPEGRPLSRPLTVFLPIELPLERAASVLLDAPDRWLPDARRAGSEMWLVTLEGPAIDRVVEMTIGAPWHTSEGIWRRLAWTPEPHDADVLPMERLLPAFTGELGVHRAQDGNASLVLTGSYEVPGRRLGEMVDAVLLGRVARMTSTRFLAGISSALTAAAPTERAEADSPR